MDYENVTVQDCMDMKNMKGQETVLNDGKVEGFHEEPGPLDALIIKDWMENLVITYTRMRDLRNFDSEIKMVYPGTGIHIDTGIDRIAEKAGIILEEKQTKNTEYPYRYSFRYKDVEFYQISRERLFTGIPADTREKAG